MTMATTTTTTTTTTATTMKATLDYSKLGQYGHDLDGKLDVKDNGCC